MNQIKIISSYYDYNCVSALHLAALQHNSCISSLLLGKGATVDVVNSAGSTPLQIAGLSTP